MSFPVVQDKVIIVTGGAMGMGEATARLLGASGAKVVVADIDTKKGCAVADAIVDDGGQAICYQVDISDTTQVQAMVQAAVKAFGRLDGAVNNAALTPDNAPVAEFDEDYWDRLISIDLKGTALCMKYEIAQLLEQGDGGSIVNVSSVSGFRPQPNNIAYVAAKHGVEGMTKVAALENGTKGIRVNSVAPGAIDTPMLRGSMEETGADPEEFAGQLSLLGRFGQASEIAEGSLWLLSDQASYVTGTCLHVDAGYVTGR